MTDPNSQEEIPEETPPPKPPRPAAQRQLEADELYARQLAEHYNSAPRRVPRRDWEEDYEYEYRRRRDGYDSEDREYSFFDGVLSCQTAFSRTVTNCDMSQMTSLSFETIFARVFKIPRPRSTHGYKVLGRSSRVKSRMTPRLVRAGGPQVYHDRAENWAVNLAAAVSTTSVMMQTTNF